MYTSIVDKFLVNYQKEYDFYLNIARMCAEQCENGLNSNGIRTIVTYRAKRIDSLKEKLENRIKIKDYKSIEDINKDIKDFAGVRIAVYFPSEIVEIEKFIEKQFSVVDKKNFPQDSNFEEKGVYENQFAGYKAFHFRVKLKENNIKEVNKRYCSSIIEIQVASVLMHAWAEVNHDLVYKPNSGELSLAEYEILDELNGLVLTGEIALKRLQSAGQERVSKDNKAFNNHYELSAFIYDLVKDKQSDIEPNIGRADLLFKLLKLAQKNEPITITDYFNKTEFKWDREITEQLIDTIISADKDLYSLYENARRNTLYLKFNNSNEIYNNESLGKFISTWIELEYFIKNAIKEKDIELKYNRLFDRNLLIRNEIFDESTYNKIEGLRRFRNEIVHGIEYPSSEMLDEGTNEIRNILNMFTK